MKKLFSLFAAILFAGSMMAGSYTITFKDSGSSSDNSTKRTTIEDIISDGASYVSAVTADNVYNARSGRGIKLGTSSKTGTLTLTLADEVKATSIVVSVRKYSDTEKTFTIQGKDYTADDGDEFTNATYTYENATAISSIVLGSTPKRIYFTSVTVNYEGEDIPVTVANYCQTEIGHFAAENADPNSYVLLSIGTKGGKTIVRIDQDSEKNTQMFDYLQVTGLAQTGEDVAEGGVAAMAVEFDTPALTNDSMTLEILWSTVNWPGRWMVQNIRVAAAECAYAVIPEKPLVPVTCAEVYAMEKDAKVALKDVTVTYANGKNVYVKDETGAMLLYLPANATWKAGDKLAGIEGVVDIYNGLYEIKPTAEQVAAVVATAGEAPAPVELAVAPVAADVNKYVILKNVSVAAGEFTTAKATNLDLTIGDATVVLRNNFKLAQTFEADAKYDIVATVAVYNTTVQLYFISAEELVPTSDRRINAYGLNVVANGDDYVFTYYANIDGNEANIVFYKDGVVAGKVAIDAPKQGVNDATIAKDELPAGTNMTWGVELKANVVTEFGKLAEGEALNKCHLAIDNSPESDYFGRMYVANRAGSGLGGIYVYNQDFTVHTSNTLAGQPKWQSMGRPAVGADGTVYIGDWGDGHGGVYVMDPANLTATCLFDGTQNASTGLWMNNEVALGSSTAAVGVYGEGANTVLYAMNEDVSNAGTTLYAHGVNVYQLGKEDGTVAKTWNTAPTMTFALQDNAAQMFVINPTSKGAFFSCSRAKPNNASGARSLQFYNTKGERTFVALPEGATADLTGSLGGGCAVSRDENTLAIVDGDGNILVYAIEWTEDTPALTLVTKYTTGFAALGSLCFDYAGNIVVTAGSNYGNAYANKLAAYGVPTNNNEIIVPAKKALVVSGMGTAIDNTLAPAQLQKVIRDGEVLIIRDGKTYNVMGQIVR